MTDATLSETTEGESAGNHAMIACVCVYAKERCRRHTTERSKSHDGEPMAPHSRGQGPRHFRPTTTT